MTTISRGDEPYISRSDTPPSPPYGGAGLIDFGQVFQILWRHKMKIALSALVFLCLGFAYTTLTPKTYRATATLLIDPRQERALNVEAVLGGIGADSAAISSQIEVIRSRTLLRKVFDDLGLAHSEEFSSSSLLGTLRSMVGMAAPAPDADARFETFRDRVSAEREGLTYILRVSFESGDPERAALITNAIVERYLNEQSSAKSQANSGVSAQINERITDLQQQVSQSEQAVEDFRARHGIISSGSGTPLGQAQIDQLSSQLVVAQANLRDTQSRLDQAVAASQNGSDQIPAQLAASSPNLQTLLEERDGLTIEINRLSTSLGPLHPTLAQMRQERDDLVNLIRAEKSLLVSQITSERDLARSQVEATQAELDALTTGLQQNNSLEIELRQLERQADATRVVLESFLQRAQETREMGGFETADAVVLSAAVPPSSALWPRGSLVLAFSLMLGSMVGALWAFFSGNGASAPYDRPLDPTPSPDRSTRVFKPDFDNRELRVVGASATPAQAPVARAEPLPVVDHDTLVEGVIARIRTAVGAPVIYVRGQSLRTERTHTAYRLARELDHKGWRSIVLDREPEISVALDARFQGRRVSDRIHAGGQRPSLFDPVRRIDVLVDDGAPMDRSGSEYPSLVALLGETYDVIIVNDTAATAPGFAPGWSGREVAVLCLTDAERAASGLTPQPNLDLLVIRAAHAQSAQERRTA